MKRHLLTAAILLIAVALYAFGFSSGTTVLVAAGVVCEAWFWARALGFTRRRERSPSP
ncbi:hypothetical protein ACPWT1_22635 [Ramlibacter sp. MMS24-I3-19]|uniref:hypothetical protein n=1 Tax=Ramlibacter sp. MMS24-I3-19 TaxID=3416606 RepID=UPI003D07FF96